MDETERPKRSTTVLLELASVSLNCSYASASASASAAAGVGGGGGGGTKLAGGRTRTSYGVEWTSLKMAGWCWWACSVGFLAALAGSLNSPRMIFSHTAAAKRSERKTTLKHETKHSFGLRARSRCSLARDWFLFTAPNNDVTGSQ